MTRDSGSSSPLPPTSCVTVTYRIDVPRSACLQDPRLACIVPRRGTGAILSPVTGTRAHGEDSVHLLLKLLQPHARGCNCTSKSARVYNLTKAKANIGLKTNSTNFKTAFKRSDGRAESLV